MTPTDTVEEYRETLRRGDLLSPYFAEREGWRFGELHTSASRGH